MDLRILAPPYWLTASHFTGYFVNGKIVSVCDAPDMPYMEDKIQHTGICTLEEERREGYAPYAIHSRLLGIQLAAPMLAKLICNFRWDQSHSSRI